MPPTTGPAGVAPLSGRALVLLVPELELLSLPVLWQPVAINPRIASKKNIFFIALCLIKSLYFALQAIGVTPATCTLINNCKNYAMRFAVNLRGF